MVRRGQENLRSLKKTSKDTRARFERNGAVEEKQLWKELSDAITMDFFTQSEVEELRRKQEELEGTVSDKVATHREELDSIL